MGMRHNQSMQRMRASRSDHLQPPRRRRLALTADPRRSVMRYE